MNYNLSLAAFNEFFGKMQNCSLYKYSLISQYYIRDVKCYVFSIMNEWPIELSYLNYVLATTWSMLCYYLLSTDL